MGVVFPVNQEGIQPRCGKDVAPGLPYPHWRLVWQAFQRPQPLSEASRPLFSGWLSSRNRLQCVAAAYL